MSQGIFNELLYCHKVNNYIEDATDTAAGNDKFNADDLATMTVPAGKRWIVLGGVVYRDVNAVLSIVAKDESDQNIYNLAYSAAATGLSAWPNIEPEEKGGLYSIIILDAGEYVQFDFGAGQGANAFLSCVVLEVDV